MKKLVSNIRESDGRFALRLESERSAQADMRRQEAAEQRRAQVLAENAEWAAAHNVDESELHMLFA